MPKQKLNLTDQLRRHAAFANDDLRLGDQEAFESAASEIEKLHQLIALARATALEEAAALIEKNQIIYTATGKTLSPRHEDNTDGMTYAIAIRALIKYEK